ncbi:hypothetical protein [Spirosoma agri]|uniref:Uncharacterized protein n=1 Tax=Spirosoma agri TaxID=1987381 RepID=A0A6M0IJA5_9BACT|nr:hypothetical protein [Spirosoma agri]NEU67907.1 hypothetical protein [Spirosoma agri]
MELTHNYKQQATFTRLRTQYKHILGSFISQHSEVFEALSRGGTPHGGNWLPTNRPETTTKSVDSIREKMAAVQQQLDVLTRQLTRLSNEMGELERASKNRMPTPIAGESSEIGINRFRATPVN